jgi:hypothetical protein
MTEPILATDNRSRCSFCNNNIKKGTYYFSEDYSGNFGRSRKNICVDCMIKGLEINLGDKKDLLLNIFPFILKNMEKQIEIITKEKVIEALR